MTVECPRGGDTVSGFFVSTILSLLAWMVLPSALLNAQTDASLGDIARQARGERGDAKAGKSFPVTPQTRRLVEELGQKQEEMGSAPEGFDSYLADDYSVWVPSPYAVEGRNDKGTLLATADFTGVTTKVFAADPIQTLSHLTPLEFEKLALAFWRPYGWIKCEKVKPGIADHRCTLGGQLLGNRVDGVARLVEGEGRVVPVVCFATALPDEGVDFSKARNGEDRNAMVDRALRNMGHRSMAQRSQDLCGAVLDSVRLKERPASLRASARPSPGPPTAPGEMRGDESSLGALARKARSVSAQGASARIKVEAQETIDRAPAGFRIHSETRCAAQCRQESFVLPENARRVKGGNSENVYVGMLDAATSIIIYFGRTQVVNGYSEYGIAQDLAHRWIHAQRDYAFKNVDLSRTEGARLVPITRFRLIANMNSWMEDEATVGEGNDHFKIGCIAREDRFADAESVCSTVFESWRVHTE